MSSHLPRHGSSVRTIATPRGNGRRPEAQVGRRPLPKRNAFKGVPKNHGETWGFHEEKCGCPADFNVDVLRISMWMFCGFGFSVDFNVDFMKSFPIPIASLTLGLLLVRIPSEPDSTYIATPKRCKIVVSLTLPASVCYEFSNVSEFIR